MWVKILTVGSSWGWQKMSAGIEDKCDVARDEGQLEEHKEDQIIWDIYGDGWLAVARLRRV
jgi:hypothetical protein